MPTSLFAKIARKAAAEVKHLTMCTVSGYGEFAIDPQWREKLAVAHDHFEKVHVVTNLSLIRDDDDLDTLARLATEVRVSINAAREAHYARIHRPPSSISFQTVERSVKKLAARQGPRFSVRLSFLELADNKDQTGQWIEKWRGQVSGLEVWRPHNWITGRTYRNPRESRLTSCGRPAMGPIQVQVDGTVNVCCFDFNGEMIIGDVRTQSFEEIFAGSQMKKIRRLHQTGLADELPLCAICDQREPLQKRKRHMVYCSWTEPDDRVAKTSSGGEKIPDFYLGDESKIPEKPGK